MPKLDGKCLNRIFLPKYLLYNQGVRGSALATNQKVGSSNLSGRTVKFMKRYTLIILAGLTLGALASLWGQDLTITNARVVAANGTLIERGSIVVRAGKIVSVAPGGPSAASGRTIDAKGMTAMPGFIDGHRHINTGPNEKAQMQALLEAG